MRIRKNLKISPLIYAAASLKPGTVLQAYDCQLNQSPWDVMSFTPPSMTPQAPSPPSEVNRDDVSAGNGSSGHCVSVVESKKKIFLVSVDRELNTWRQWEYSNDLTDGIITDKVDKMEVQPPEQSPEQPPEKNEQIVLCCKTDGKSWQCRREAAKGNSLCEHHLSLVKNYNNSATKKSGKQVAAEAPPPPRRPRPKKAATSSSANPYEFYYYSGFGPRWGKKRGETSKDGGSSSMHEIEPPAVSPIGDEVSDYVEYEDEEEDDEETKGDRKKRGRKPIKARSLKSLM